MAKSNKRSVFKIIKKKKTCFLKLIKKKPPFNIMRAK